MAEEVRSYSDMTPEEVYARFLKALSGLEDDAGIEGYSQEGLDHLRAAQSAFQKKFSARHGSSVS
jgi:hypothetical protein